MPQQTISFLPGVPAAHVLERLSSAGGDELDSGKIASPESSAALAVNTFGWFVERPARLPPFPFLDQLDWPAKSVEVEYCARFPWRGGRHPWLDAFIETPSAIIGVESKRFEPFRNRKRVALSLAYDRPLWGERMGPFEVMRSRLRSGEKRFEHLDAAQLVKHAFGLVTEGRRKAKAPHLVYLFSEPTERGGEPIPDAAKLLHREEVAQFAGEVANSEVSFTACSYREWLGTWPGSDDLAAHRDAILARFNP